MHARGRTDRHDRIFTAEDMDVVAGRCTEEKAA
jgi:hypothetical protein